MRARLAAVVPALLSVALVAGGCGGDDGNATATPSATPVAGTSQAGASGSGVSPTTGTGGGSGSSSGSGDSGSGTKTNPSGLSTKDSLTTQISKNPDLRTFSTALNAAGLGSVLDSGTYTVFAPNNDAFTKLGSQLDTLLQPGAKAQLQNILRFHIVKGRYRTSKLTDGTLLTTIQGDRLRVTKRSDGELIVGNSLGKAVVVTPNAKASNGVIHTVDTVLKPKSSK